MSIECQCSFFKTPNTFTFQVAERSSELFSALVIKKVALEHCGTYTCVASNHVAKVNKSTELYIKGKSIILHLYKK